MTTKKTRIAPVVMGAIQGSIELPASLCAQAQVLAKQVLADGEAEDFGGEPVSWLSDKQLIPVCMSLFPTEAVRALGYEPAPGKDAKVYGTYGVGPHEDDVDGIVFIMVLENKGLKFKQKGQSHITLPGQWFLFNDRDTHEVKEGKNSVAYVFFHVPLRPIK